MPSIAILSALFGMSLSLPLATRQVSETLFELPIMLQGEVRDGGASITATTEHSGTTEIIHFGNISIPAFNVDNKMLTDGFDLQVKTNVMGALIEFPIHMHKIADDVDLTKRQNDIKLGPFTISGMDINIDGVKDGVNWDAKTPLGDMTIDISRVNVNSKRQANFFDEVIDIGIQVDDIIINTKRQANFFDEVIDIGIQVDDININTKRQANFFDEVIDIGIQIGDITINTKRDTMEAEKRQNSSPTLEETGTSAGEDHLGMPIVIYD